MTTFRSENVLVGIFALAVVPWILWTMVRGLRDGRLPIGRSYVVKDERPAAYRVLLVFWMFMTLITLMVCLDLLLGIDVRFWL